MDRRFYLLSLSMLLVGCLLGLGSATNAFALHPRYEAAMNQALIDISYERPAYISPKLIRKDGSIGARLKYRKEVDCSLLFGRAAQDIAIPDFQYRPTASSMYRQQGNWKSRPVDIQKDNRPCDLIFQHFPESKGGLKKPKSLDDPYGVNHVLGVVLHRGVYKVIHASSSAQTVVMVTFQEWIEKYMVPNGYRRLTYGD